MEHILILKQTRSRKQDIDALEVKNRYNQDVMNDYKQLAIDLAHQAGEVMRKNFSLGMKKEWKDDETPLTASDTAINHLVLERIKKVFPKHSILSEEGGNKTNSEYCWVCDPIDGTVAFSHGYPTFTFSLALTKNGESILGVIYDPITDRLFYAEKGKGAFLNDKKISVSTASGFNNTLINLDTDYIPNIREALIKEGAFTPTLYSAVYTGTLVACGEFGGEVYAYDKPWDGAALKIIVEEAGGKVTDLDGKEQRYDQTINGFVATNGILHNLLINLISAARSNQKN